MINFYICYHVYSRRDKKRADDFKQICVIHKVKTLYAFGSSINEEFDPENSDIDLLVDLNTFDPIERGELLINLWDTLEVFSTGKLIY